MNHRILKDSLLSLTIILFGCNGPARLPDTTIKTDSTIVKTDSMIEKKSDDSINNKYGKQNGMLTNEIDFTASGNEPFWSLEIDFNKSMHFKTVTGFEITTPVPGGVIGMDANVTRYSAKTEQGVLTLEIAKQKCINDMSGKESDYNVLVDVKTNIDKGYTTYKGCGDYITDYRLHDIWVLEEINGQPVNVQQYGKESPRIEINSSQNSFMGYTGSHDINGKIFFEKGLLRFNDVMAPQDLNKAEKEFIKDLQSATGYKLENNRLVLFNPAGELMQFKKTD
jgi:uncharacterized membrane protein/heat shock protein HslJ